MRPVLAFDDFIGAIDLAKQHDPSEVLEPVGSELLVWHRVYHWISVATLDLLGELVGEVAYQRGRNLGTGHKGHYSGNGLAVPEGYLTWPDIDGQGRLIRVRVRECAGHPMNGRGRRIIHNGRHLVGVPGETVSVVTRWSQGEYPGPAYIHTSAQRAGGCA
ncbi:hypothetical protein O1611_g7655 [Lasiodiplodia mahajangana]|uniref:Uncharacterized protein n=1 Tax=Lasiodiplodia mahajangana TaxID=1108764 RepID=A0ACC2JES8_9PEZI|nr:hypothetical protein O1611_g7655 [Lasiodiplodia mahajangana]